MTKHMIIQTVETWLFGVVTLGLALFLPAWTFNYWQAWVFIVVFLGSTTIVGIDLALHNPELVERRKKVGPTAEQSLTQKVIITLSLTGCAGLVVFCALAYRFVWAPVPAYISWVGDVLVALGYLIDWFVFKENSFGAASIQTFEGQHVVSTGLYAYMRHPMYMGVLVMMIGVSLALGSWWGLVVVALLTLVLVWRILDEEHFLKRELAGYSEYAQKVPYRLVPYLW